MYGASFAQKVQCLPGKYRVGRKDPRTGIQHHVKYVTIHHMATVVNNAINCVRSWQNSGRVVSSHYLIGNSGDCVQYVDEKDTAFTNSNIISNMESITIEVSNSTLAPDWKISEAAMATLVKLLYDIARRNNMLPLRRPGNINYHREYANTNCPGPYIEKNIQTILSRANSLSEPINVNKWVSIYDKKTAGLM